MSKTGSEGSPEAGSPAGGDLHGSDAGDTAASGAPRGGRIRGLARDTLIVGAVSLLLLLLLEGAASSLFVVRHIHENQLAVETTEERHTRYDEGLGWVSIPEVRIPDLYGPGKGLTTNSRGFRGTAEYEAEEPDGTSRILCSGDSFTLGHGVADEDAWCGLLATEEPLTEAVNLGQGGYGIGQAFLWYRRAAADLDRSIHLFAVIGDDFYRTGRDHFLGFGKPVISVQDGELTVLNTPAPRRGALSRWMVQNGALFREFRTVRLLGGVLSRLAPPPDASAGGATWTAVQAAFDSLASENSARGARLVLVFLPTPWDYDTDLYDVWRNRMHEYSERTGVPLIDMVDELRALEEDVATGMFIPDGEEGAPHFNERGNLWVAQHLSTVLRSIRADSTSVGESTLSDTPLTLDDPGA